jgi:hypothetical protein
MLGRLFGYYKTQNNYENAKKALLKAFKYVKGSGYIPEVRSYAHYNKVKHSLVEADWKEIEPIIIKERFSYLKVEFKKRPPFLDELKNYEKREQYDLDDQ